MNGGSKTELENHSISLFIFSSKR